MAAGRQTIASHQFISDLCDSEFLLAAAIISELSISVLVYSLQVGGLLLGTGNQS